MRCYNGFGQLASVNRDMAVTRYRYRPDGLRHSAETDGRTTVYHWDGQNLVRESNGDGGTKATYLRGAQLIAQVIDCTLFYYLLNAHGDVVQRVDAKRQAAPRYEYDAFGVQRERVGYDADKDPNPLRYCGEYWDDDTQELYLRARTYQPRNGRFTQEDPVRDGSNWYAYCNGEPVGHGDPSGLWTSAFWEEQLIDSKIKEAEKKRKPSGTQSVPTWDYGEPGGYIPPNPAPFVPPWLEKPRPQYVPPSSVSVPSGGGIQGCSGQYSNEPSTSTNPRSSANPESYFYNPNRDQLKHSAGDAFADAWNAFFVGSGPITVWGEDAEEKINDMIIDAGTEFATSAYGGGGYTRDFSQWRENHGATVEYNDFAALEGLVGSLPATVQIYEAMKYYELYGGFSYDERSLLQQGLNFFIGGPSIVAITPPPGFKALTWNEAWT